MGISQISNHLVKTSPYLGEQQPKIVSTRPLDTEGRWSFNILFCLRPVANLRRSEHDSHFLLHMASDDLQLRQT